jgi:hypothetical protein
LYWNGTAFGDWEYGKFNPVGQDGVVSWQGYNWDTTDWANQPPEPPEAVCKKCKWTGNRDAMRQDDTDYEYHCPECDSTNWDWIEYDPETAKGRKNRDKYCQPAVSQDWDPAEELDKILDEFEDLVADETPWTPVKTKPAEPGVYECQFKKLPAWPWPPVEQLQWTGKQWLNDEGDIVKGVKDWRVPQEETQ